MLPLLAALLPLTYAADVPSWYVKQGVAVAGWPTGALWNTIGEVRTPLHRSESVLFQTTSAGIGAQVLASPAFVTVGPRVSFAPIEVFDVNLKAARAWYFDGGLGLMPFDGLAGTLGSERDARNDEGFGAQGWVLSVEPTLKAKVWKIVVFDAWTVDRLLLDRPPEIDAAFTYEPLRDLVIAFEDTAVEQHAGLLYEVLPGGDRPSLRIGPTYRDRFTVASKDRSATLGLLVAAKPGVKPAVPTLVGLALWYLVDTDREGPIPLLAAQARWEFEGKLAKD